MWRRWGREGLVAEGQNWVQSQWIKMISVVGFLSGRGLQDYPQAVIDYWAKEWEIKLVGSHGRKGKAWQACWYCNLCRRGFSFS